MSMNPGARYAPTPSTILSAALFGNFPIAEILSPETKTSASCAGLPPPSKTRTFFIKRVMECLVSIIIAYAVKNFEKQKPGGTTATTWREGAISQLYHRENSQALA